MQILKVLYCAPEAPLSSRALLHSKSICRTPQAQCPNGNCAMKRVRYRRLCAEGPTELCKPSSKPHERGIAFSVTRVAATMGVIAGLAAGGESAAARTCRLGHHDACVSVSGATAQSSPYQLERVVRGDAGRVLTTAIRRSTRPRIVVHPRRPYPAEEHGAIYGYAPGSYLLGRAGVLYGPYPLDPDAPIAELRY